MLAVTVVLAIGGGGPSLHLVEMTAELSGRAVLDEVLGPARAGWRHPQEAIEEGIHHERLGCRCNANKTFMVWPIACSRLSLSVHPTETQ